MLANLLPSATNILLLAGYFLSFALTVLLLAVLKNKLPRDGGRKFAVNGELSQGKARGAGIILVAVILFCGIMFIPTNTAEFPIYCACILASMLSGYFDDASEKPWNEYLKGALDLVIALALAFTFVHYNGAVLNFALLGTSVTLPKWLFIILAVILIWASINVVNCTDGVDGLCASLSIVSFLGFLLVIVRAGRTTALSPLTVMFIMSLLGYLWFNSSPSSILMGDAGSRALGIFLALLALYCDPLLFLALGSVFILDGGLGLIKVSLLRFLKISIMKNIRTPLHDHFRKNKKWSDTQTVFRFIILQAVIMIIVVLISPVK